MEIKRPLLLISNDDGYQAKGINSLIDMLSGFGDIIVCAPDDARSGFSCAFSSDFRPLQFRSLPVSATGGVHLRAPKAKTLEEPAHADRHQGRA